MMTIDIVLYIKRPSGNQRQQLTILKVVNSTFLFVFIHKKNYFPQGTKNIQIIYPKGVTTANKPESLNQHFLKLFLLYIRTYITFSCFV